MCCLQVWPSLFYLIQLQIVLLQVVFFFSSLNAFCFKMSLSDSCLFSQFLSQLLFYLSLIQDVCLDLFGGSFVQ